MATLYSYALTSVADVKELLGIDSGDSSKNNLITRKINQATDMIESYCNLPYNHHFKEATYTNETYEGNGSDTLFLKMSPVTAVGSFGYRNTTLNEDSFTSIDTQDYFIDEDTGTLALLFDTWGGWGAYRVTYTAGFSTIPSDLAEAAAMLAANLVGSQQSLSTGQAVQSIREGQRQITYAEPGQNSTDSLIEQLGIDDILNRYTRISLGAV